MKTLITLFIFGILLYMIIRTIKEVFFKNKGNGGGEGSDDSGW